MPHLLWKVVQWEGFLLVTPTHSAHSARWYTHILHYTMQKIAVDGTQELLFFSCQFRCLAWVAVTRFFDFF